MPADRVQLGFGNASRAQQTFANVDKIVLNSSFPDFALIKLTNNLTYFNNFSCYDINVTDPVTNLTKTVDYCSQANATRLIVVDSLTLATEPPQDGDNLTVAGWGAIHTDGFVTVNELHGFWSNYSANLTCGLSSAQNETHFCFGSPATGLDACAADYGTPLVNAAGEQVGMYIKSQGDQQTRKNCRGHGVYARTDILAEWVVPTIRDFSKGASDASQLAPITTVLLLLLAFLSFLSIC
jgi:hypothetical protein